MSNYNSLKATIDANINQNGNQEITGQVLNSVLNQMVTTLGAGYQFAGVATLDPATDPGTPDAKVFYIANGKGTYTNFGGINVTEDDVVVLYWDSSWHKVATGIASQEKLSELEGKVDSIIGVETELSLDLTNTGRWDTNGELIENQWYRRTPGIVDVSQYKEVKITISYSGTPSPYFAAIILYKDGVLKTNIKESEIDGTYVFETTEYNGFKFCCPLSDVGNANCVVTIHSPINKETIGLGNVDNTSDADKPLSNAAIAEFGNIKEELDKVANQYPFCPKVIGDFPYPAGETFNIYRENVVTNNQEQEIVDYNANDMDEKKFMLKQSTNGNKSYDYIIYNTDFTKFSKQKFTINYKAKNTNAKKVMLIGDSTIDTIVGSEVKTNRIVNFINEYYGGNLILIGTRGDAPYKHCGIGGWSAYDWVNSQTDGRNANPMYNPSTGKFDFSYGLSINSLETPNVVIIQLGINDVTATTQPTQFATRLEQYIESMQWIVNSIKAKSSSIKVCVNMILPPSKKWSDYTAYAGAILTPNIAKWHNIVASNAALTRLKNVDYFLPINAVIDRDTMLDDRVHPNTDGYREIAKFLANILSVIELVE